MARRAGFAFRAEKGNARMHLQVQLDHDGSPDALLRVLTTLRRRGCTILGVHYAQGDRHRPGLLELSVDAPPRIGARLEAWLGQLVEVREARVG